MIKSPLRYPGGKSKAVKFIAPIIPKFQEYREPFLGGGSIFIYLKQQYPNKNYWVNDLYSNLYYFWKHTQLNIGNLIRQVSEWKNKFKDGRKLHRFLLDNIVSFNEIEKAAAFFIFNRITFSGTSESGGFSKAAYINRFTLSCINRLENVAPILMNTIVTNKDFQEVVEERGKNVFIFLDPPYYSAKKSALYGKNGRLHKTFDHERLARVLQKTKHKWLVTYDDCKHIRRLFSFAYINEWNMTYGMKNVKKYGDNIGKELFISNYKLQLPKPNTQRTLFGYKKVEF